MTGFEYSAAAHMLYAGMVKEGVECIGNIRRRYDGERRNPWDEAECGHHYARAMAAWSGTARAERVSAIDGAETEAGGDAPGISRKFACFWSTANGWGTFSVTRQQSGHRFELNLEKGSLECAACTIRATGGRSVALLNGKPVAHRVRREAGTSVFEFEQPVRMKSG